MIIVELKNVSKNFHAIKALNNINLTINKGEMIGLVGPNGAGKTTTLRIISTILKPDNGKAYVYGKNIALYQKDIKKLIGYLPEAPRLYENIKVIDCVKIFAKGRGLLFTSNSLLSLFEEWSLIEIANRKISTLSKGQRQKVSLLCSLIHDPQLILLDEPFSGLDIESREFIRERIGILKEKGKTILISSHDLDEVERLVSIIAIIAKGEILLKGNIEEVKRKLLGYVYRLKVSKIPEDLELINKIIKGYTLDRDNSYITFQVRNREDINEVLKFFMQRGCIIFSLQPLRLEEHISAFLREI